MPPTCNSLTLQLPCRCPAAQNGAFNCRPKVTQWINNVIAFAKSQGKQQMYTFGQEGFFSKDSVYQPGKNNWIKCNPWGIPSNVGVGAWPPDLRTQCLGY